MADLEGREIGIWVHIDFLLFLFVAHGGQVANLNNLNPKPIPIILLKQSRQYNPINVFGRPCNYLPEGNKFLQKKSRAVFRQYERRLRSMEFDRIIKVFFKMGEEQKKAKPDLKDVENGPLSEAQRECRDVFCCILFIANVVAMVYCTIHAYTNGDPSLMFRGVAQDGVVCGETGGVAESYPYLYFYNPIDSVDNRVCVKECPAYSGGTLSTLDCYAHGVTCTYDVTVAQDGSVSSVSGSDFIGYETSVTIDRICMPSSAVLSDAFASVVDSLSSSMQTGDFASMTSDVENNWQWLLCAIAFAVIVSLVFMFLLRCLVGCIVWLSIIGSILVFVGLGVIFLYNGGKISSSAVGFLGLPTLSGSDYYNTYGYICFGVAGFLLIMLICCCNRLRLAVAVCKVAGQFVIRVCQVTLVPIVLAAILIGMWAVCLLCMIYLLSATTFTTSMTGSSYDVFTSVESYSQSSLLRLYYFIFATLWCNALIQAIGTFVIASACCMWYFSHGANDELDSPVTRSFWRAFRYHFGSLAFGSFILAVVQFLQVMLEVFKKQAEQTGADQNKCFEYIINCLRCCLACVERIVQFINKTAYIQIALRGKNFCMAAKDGFEIVWSNGMRYLIVAGVGGIMMFIGRIMIAAGTTAGFYVLITFVQSIKDNILEPIYLLIIVFIIGFSVGTLFIAIYGIAIDTILACFIVDEMNQQAAGGKRALHAPEELNVLLPDEE